MTAQTDSGCSLINRFSLKERIVMRTAWAAFTAIGAYGIYVQSPLWAAIYLMLTALGFILVVLPALCAHCPFPSRHNTCLFIPPGFVKRFYPYKGPDMRAGEKCVTLAAMAGMVAMPNVWLVNRPTLLILFWLVALPTLAAFPRHYCRHCRHFGCPLNKAKNRDSI